MFPDEKSQIHALDCTQRQVPPSYGVAALHSPDYVRHETTSPVRRAGFGYPSRMEQLHRRYRGTEFLEFSQTSHFYLHLTSAPGSGLNLVECGFALLTQRQIKRGSHRCTVQPECAIRDYFAVYSQNPIPSVWHKTADEIVEAITRFLHAN